MDTYSYDQDGKPIEKLSWCAYLDILGYKQELIVNDNSNASQEYLNRIYSAMSKYVAYDSFDSKKPFPKDSFIKYKIFSDNIVFGLPFDSVGDPTSEGEFGSLLIQIAYFQLLLALENIFIRGGFTLGRLYIGSELVFGKALLDAYEIESKVSVNPRIVMSEPVKSVILQQLKSTDKDAPQIKMLLKDVDGKWFINYLYMTVNDYDGGIMLELLLKHKENIEANLLKYKQEPTIRLKYLWLSNYHNYFCDQYKINDPVYRINSSIGSSSIADITS